MAYNAIHKFGTICFSKTYLYSITLSDDDNLLILGHNLIQADFPNNVNHAGFCIYVKDSPQ